MLFAQWTNKWNYLKVNPLVPFLTYMMAVTQVTILSSNISTILPKCVQSHVYELTWKGSSISEFLAPDIVHLEGVGGSLSGCGLYMYENYEN